jgi:hypothetical protein
VSRPELHDYACAVHLHSTYSDGTGSVRQIARAGRRAGLDVVMLTDHDTLAARDNGEEGYHDGLLLLVGEEISPQGGNHYLAFGIDAPVRHQGLSAAEICTAVAEAGGFGFAAHPFSRGSERFARVTAMPWRDLDAPDLHGIELWSFVNDNGERIRSLREAAAFIARPGRFVDHPPERNLEAWDRLCAERRVVAIGGVDAHQVGLRVLGRVPLRLMSYRRSFSQLRTHVLCSAPLSGELERDRELVYDALRAGCCYIAVDSIRAPTGFAFWAEHGRTAGLAPGAEGPAALGWELHARVPAPARLRLLAGGKLVNETEGGGVHHHVDRPGAYRIEARVEHKGRERTWIVSNPIYLR